MFKSPYFIWKGESCKDYFIMITTTDNEVVNDFGLPYSKSLTKEEGKFIYKEEDVDTEEIEMNLTLIDEATNTGVVWTQDTYRRICKWLKSDEFEKFISYDDLDSVYYMKVVKIQPCFTHGNPIGWIKVTFKPLDNNAYRICKVDEIVRGTKEITIYNDSEDDYEPLLIITNLGSDDNTISVNDFSITDLKEDETVYVDNYMTTVVNTYGENRLPGCNREWIKLKPGENKLFVSGDCMITVYCEFPHEGW